MATAPLSQTKVCTKCGVEKAHSEYRKRAERPIGIRSSCRECDVAAERRYRAVHKSKPADPEKSRATSARFRERHRDLVREREKAFRDANREAIREAERKRYAANREKIRERKRLSRLANRDKHIEAERANRECNREYHREKSRRACAKRRATPKGLIENRVRSGINARIRGGTKFGKSTFELLDFTPEQLVYHIEKQFTQGMSWENYGDWHIDHIIPCAEVNYETPYDLGFKIVWALTNLRPLWAEDNLRKGAKRLLLL